MKKLLTGALFAAMAGSAQAEDVTLQLKWVTQAQFAGYYVAKDKGFFEEEGLNVTIKPGGPDLAPPQVIAGGGADVVVDWMPSALAAREKGLALVNIAQPFKSSGMMLTCLKETGIQSPADFADKTLGVWFFGNEYPFLSWMSQLGLKTDGSPGGVTVLKHNLKRIKQRVDHAEHGGGLLLGVNGVCIIGHGSSRAPSAFGAIRQAKAAVDSRVIERIQAQYQQSVQQVVASEN